MRFGAMRPLFTETSEVKNSFRTFFSQQLCNTACVKHLHTYICVKIPAKQSEDTFQEYAEPPRTISTFRVPPL